MLLKLMGGIVICIGTWYLGKNISENYLDNMKIIDDYLLFLNNFKSAVAFSGMNMYEFFERNDISGVENLLEFLLIKRNTCEIKNFKGKNVLEDKCVNLVSQALMLAQRSSDTKVISDIIDQSINELNRCKKEFWEEHCGKIKTAPKIGLISGLFVAVLVI